MLIVHLSIYISEFSVEGEVGIASTSHKVGHQFNGWFMKLCVSLVSLWPSATSFWQWLRDNVLTLHLYSINSIHKWEKEQH